MVARNHPNKSALPGNRQLSERVWIITLLVAALLLWLPVSATATGTFTYVQVAVGQGDAAVVQGPCGALGMIDANRNSSMEVLAVLDSFGSRELEWMVVTHYDTDHIGGIVPLARADGVSVRTVYDRGGGQEERKSKTFASYLDWVTSEETTRNPVAMGKSFSLCEGDEEVIFEVVSVGTDGTAAGDVNVTEENDKGICLKIVYRKFKAATCGDINGTDIASRTDVESAVAPLIGQVDFAKINHHGSAHSNNQTFIETLRPRASVVSTGANNYGHPDETKLEQWSAYGEVYRTQNETNAPVDGNVTVTTDGESSFTVETTSGRKDRFALQEEQAAMPVDIVPDLTLVSICLAYLIIAWLLQMYRVVAPRDWLRQRIRDARARFDLSSSERDNLDWIEQSIDKGWWRLPTSRVQAGWRHIHGVEDAHITELTENLVNERLRSARTRLAAITGKAAKSFVERIDTSLKSASDAHLKEIPGADARRALLQETMIFLHNRSDTDYEDLAALLAKAIWLTALALALVAGLGALFDREIYFLLGAAGGLISRLTRVLRSRPKASDYGAAWSTLIVSPVAGALAGWIGVLVAAVLASDPLNALDDAFAAPWDDATNLLGLLIAFLAGFSERWFDRLLGEAEAQLSGKLPTEEAAEEKETTS